MINTKRKFKHYSEEKLTEVGFCPSVKNQVESFIQAGKILTGAQNELYQFKDDSQLNDDLEPEEIYPDKISSLERTHELVEKLSEVNREKARLEALEAQERLKNSNLTKTDKSVNLDLPDAT